jgi:1,4-alpha-glucan branching enzyme
MIVGDFNKWDTKATPLKRMRNGDFSVTLELEKGREYRFRYLIDNVKWENDWHADKYLPNAFGCDDSVVIV